MTDKRTPEYARTYQELNLQEGKCRQCPRPVVPGRKMCERCLQKANDYAKREYAKRKTS